MKIKKIIIRNLKSIGKLSLDFERPVTLIYGQNGMGKTTILEAISLLGHLPMMRQIEIQGLNSIDSKNSTFLQLLGETDKEKPGLQDELTNERISHPAFGMNDIFADLIGSLKLSMNEQTDDLENWFNNRDVKRNGEALIKYEVDVDDAHRNLLFYIYFKGREQESITKTLGRNSFNDIKMNDCYAVIWERHKSNKYEKKMSYLLDHFSKTTRFIYYPNDDADNYLFLKYLCPLQKNISKNPFPQSAESQEKLSELAIGEKIKRYVAEFLSGKSADVEMPTGFTFYLNTDLNDFGRSLDIRESVKDIGGDFIREWVLRLGIEGRPYDNKAQTISFRKKKILEKMLNDILNPKSYMSKLMRNKDTFFLHRLDFVFDGKMFTGSQIEIKRNEDDSDDEAIKLDYLSAGENECFFIFLYLLGMNIENSICLFDEPDLHLSQFSKKPFYQTLFKLLLEKHCQVIVSTHSGFAFTHKEITERYHIRKFRDNRVKKVLRFLRGDSPSDSLDKNYNFLFSIKLAWEYVRTASAILGFTFAIVIIEIMAFAALFSDIANAIKVQPDAMHITILSYISFVLLYVLGGYFVWGLTRRAMQKLIAIDYQK